VPFQHACARHAIFTVSPSQYWKASVARISSVSLLQSDIFRPRARTRLFLEMCPLVLSKAIELSLVRLWQVRTYSITVCLSLPSHSWFPSYSVSLVFFVSDLVCINV
jgi:hypothetical protein